jgi:hypothetical protein
LRGGDTSLSAVRQSNIQITLLRRIPEVRARAGQDATPADAAPDGGGARIFAEDSRAAKPGAGRLIGINRSRRLVL